MSTNPSIEDVAALMARAEKAEQALAAEVEKRQKAESVLATIKDYVRVYEVFGADEIVELCNGVVGKFSQSKGWMMAGTYREMEEDLASARAELAQTKAELATHKAANELTSDQLRFEQEDARVAHEVLNSAGIPSNGEEGHGKRQSLLLSQRVATAIKERDEARERALRANGYGNNDVTLKP